jgi:class 3 adenylate cyclase
LASFSRLIRFDIRGTGMSDPVGPGNLPTLEELAEDMLAVLDAVGSPRPALFANQTGGLMTMFFAATHPERTSALMLAGCWPRHSWAPDYPWGIGQEEQELRLTKAEGRWDKGVYLVRLMAPSVAEDPAFVDWYARFIRLTLTPAAGLAVTRMNFEADLRHLLPTIQAPTLVLYRKDDRLGKVEHARYLAEHIDGAKLVELPGQDCLVYVGDSDRVVDEVEEFLTGVRGVPEPDRLLATVLFTDIVGSTERAAELGDRRWRDLLDTHDRTVRRQLDRFRGREVNTAGDGFVATFDGPRRAIECAQAIRDAVRALDLKVRVGLHTGEIERHGEDIAGLAVHIGARVAAVAEPNEVLVSSTVKDLVVGSGIRFDERGEHELKGVPGTWKVYAVEA